MESIADVGYHEKKHNKTWSMAATAEGFNGTFIGTRCLVPKIYGFPALSCSIFLFVHFLETPRIRPEGMGRVVIFSIQTSEFIQGKGMN